MNDTFFSEKYELNCIQRGVSLSKRVQARQFNKDARTVPQGYDRKSDENGKGYFLVSLTDFAEGRGKEMPETMEFINSELLYAMSATQHGKYTSYKEGQVSADNCMVIKTYDFDLLCPTDWVIHFDGNLSILPNIAFEEKYEIIKKGEMK
jgi:hypothetical protein